MPRMLLNILQWTIQGIQQSVIWSKMSVGVRLRKSGFGGKRRRYGRDRDLCQPLQFALCWESGFTRRIMLKMMMVMTTTMTMMIPFVHTTVDNGVSHSFLHEIQTNWSLFMEEETTAQRTYVIFFYICFKL